MRKKHSHDASVPLSEHIKAAVVRSLCFLVALLPLRSIQRLGALVGRVLWIVQSRAAQTTLANIRLCFPALSAAEQTALARRSLLETGKTILETCACWHWPLEKSRRLIRHVEGEQLLIDACANESGLILLVPHLSSWEMLPSFVRSYTQYTAMYKPPRIRPLDAWMQAVRHRVGSEVVPTNRRGVSELMRVLKGGGCVVILPDQEPERESGAFAPFFGVETLTMSLVQGLAVKTDAQVLELNAKRLADGGGFDIVLRDANAVNTSDVRASLSAMNAVIETAVRDIPEQYQWEYKRFKRRPEGRADFY